MFGFCFITKFVHSIEIQFLIKNIHREIGVAIGIAAIGVAVVFLIVKIQSKK